MAFDGRLDDPSLGIVAEPRDAAATTLLAFGGIRGGLGIPPYEFFRVTEDLPVRRILVRDLDQVWYLRGIRGLGDTVAAAAAALREEVGGARLVTTGNSAGGFGAIAFGALLGASEVHAFSPQTAIDRRHRIPWLDARWLPQVRRARRLPVDPVLLDLRRLLQGEGVLLPVGRPAIHLHVGGSHGRDARHARHLEGVQGVEIHRYAGAGHRLVTDLRDDGELARILRGAVA